MTAHWGPAPFRTVVEGLPERVTVYEVGPRDGLQAEDDIIATETKAQLCNRLYAAGVRDLELTSFVPASWVPQLADAAALVAAVDVPAGARGVALVPNLRGLERAHRVGIAEVAVVVSASESFARANLNASRSEALERAADVVRQAAAVGMPVRGYVSMSFGDPSEGAVDVAAVVDGASALREAGCRTIALGDTIGVATPGQVDRVLDRVVDAGVERSVLALHLHDTYGQALANVYAALRSGITEFDSSVGGLGRCPYARGSTGNLATEDLVWMLHGLGISTGLDLDALAETTAWLARTRGRAAPSRVAAALAAASEPAEANPRPIEEAPAA